MHAIDGAEDAAVAKSAWTAARAWGVAAALLAGLLSGAAMGLSFPLLSLRLEAMTGSGLVVGAAATVAAISTLIAAPIAPMLLHRIAPRLLLPACGILAALIALAFAGTNNVAAWFVLRLAFGIGMTFVFLGAEIWVNQLAPEAWRARLLGAFGAAIAGGLGLGGASFALVGAEGIGGFVLIAVYAAAAGLVILAPVPGLAAPPAEDASVRGLWTVGRLAPAALLAAAAFGAIEGAALHFLPVYAVRLGFAESAAGALLVALALGNILLQAPVGALADSIGRARVLFACAIAGLIAPLAAIVASSFGLWPLGIVIFVYGGAVVGMYAIGLAILAAKVAPGQLAQANAAYVVAYGLGSFASPLAAGIAIDRFDPHGLPLALASFAALYLLASRLWRTKPGVPETRST